MFTRVIANPQHLCPKCISGATENVRPDIARPPELWGLTSRDWTTRDHIEMVGIAWLVSVFELLLTTILCLLLGVLHKLYMSVSNMSVSSSVRLIAQDLQNRACPHDTSVKPARGDTRHTSQQSSEGWCSCCRCRFRHPWTWHLRLTVLVLAATAAVVVPRLWGLRMSADRMAELFSDFYSAVIIRHGLICSGPFCSTVRWHHCLIWCRVVQSRDARSRYFSAPISA